MSNTHHSVALITGGASGIGRACAETLAVEASTLVLLDRNDELLERQAANLRARGASVHTVVADLTESREVVRGVQCCSDFGKLDRVVNCAGVSALGTVEDTDEEIWDLIIDTKLKGYFLVCKAAIEMMSTTGGGAIVNVSSMSGRTKSIMTNPAYAAANAGVIGLSMTLAAQSAKLNIRVNCVAPGVVDTPMLSMYSKDILSQMYAQIPMARLAGAYEIAETICFLLSDRAGYITGETVNINGGAFMV